MGKISKKNFFKKKLFFYVKNRVKKFKIFIFEFFSDLSQMRKSALVCQTVKIELDVMVKIIQTVQQNVFNNVDQNVFQPEKTPSEIIYNHEHNRKRSFDEH